MDALNFAYWLQGFAELHSEPPTSEQWQAIRDHLGLVFAKVTPVIPNISVPQWTGTPPPGSRFLRTECLSSPNALPFGAAITVC